MNKTNEKINNQIRGSYFTLYGFESSRAVLLKKNIYQPFKVKTEIPLREALKSGDVREDTPILVVEHNNWRLALQTSQINYHHVAYGEVDGEPWMTSF